MTSRLIACLATTLMLAGCATEPSTGITQPLSARPVATPPATTNDGAIYRGGGLSLFEDRRARQIGDLLTVRLVERTEAKRKSETKEDRKAEAELSIAKPRILGHDDLFGSTAWNPESTTKQEFKDDESNTISVNGSITVTVVEVLANGNLVVAGEKRMSVNNDTEFIRLSGVANPRDITREGTVNSTQLADVHFESKNSQKLDQTQLTGMMARFFLTLLPF